MSLEFPVYCYGNAAFDEKRRNLAYSRSGEYEGLAGKLAREDGKPDFGKAEFNSRSGATAVGARDFLIAYNINLNTTSTRWANAIAFDVREKGRIKRRGNPLTGEIVRDGNGNPVMIGGSLKGVKGLGWYIEEYGIAQVSLNITDTAATPVHVVYDEVFNKAEARGVRVTGSEIVGLIPLRAMVDAGKYFLEKQKLSAAVSEKELIRIAVKSMGLDDLYTFRPESKIIEYMLEAPMQKLADLSLSDYADRVSSGTPAPGGGSVAACIGALVLHSERWRQIYRHTNGAGMNVGRSFPNGPGKQGHTRTN
jgi:glutamate formiminotransferase / formiminotetrahydrofolate cyclodeaminase